ncbi:MAG: CcoQ/FixQ family Cbb3-type cytochrome c oxidase assembly chaperone [Chitinophagales bacterium]
MFSFFKNYAATMSNVEIYPKIALFLFLTVFIWMIVIAVRADKRYISEIEQLPLDK